MTLSFASVHGLVTYNGSQWHICTIHYFFCIFWPRTFWFNTFESAHPPTWTFLVEPLFVDAEPGGVSTSKMKLGWWHQNVSPSNSSSWFSGRWPVKEVSLSWYGTHFLLVATVSQGSLNHPFWGRSNKQQMCGNFEGFPLKKSALFGFRFWLELQKTLQNSKDLRNHLALRLKT